MENINLQLLRKINCLLTGLLAIIGFSCGENGEIPCEYGSPHANFQIKGKVTDMKGEPIPRPTSPHQPERRVSSAGMVTYRYPPDRYKRRFHF